MLGDDVAFGNSVDHGFLKERILCGGAYRATGEKLEFRIIDQSRKLIENDRRMDSQTQKIVAAFLTSDMLEVYRQWAVEGRKILIEKMIKTISRLISNAINGLTGNTRISSE